MTDAIRPIDTLNSALEELNELLREQPAEVAATFSELLGHPTTRQIIERSTAIVQWLSDRLAELADGAEVLDVLAALAEVVLDMFRFFKEALSADNTAIPGLTELAALFPAGKDIDQVQNALDWLPDPNKLRSIQQHVDALVNASDGGLRQVMRNLEIINNTP